MRRNMMYSCSFVSVWLFWSGLMVGQQHGECAVPVKGVVSLETADRSMPGTIFLDILLNGQNVHLSLSQNPDVDPNCPVYILSTDSAGKIQLTKVQPEKSKELALYVDSKNNAALQATQGNQKDEPLHLEGIVCTSGKTYSVKSKGLSNKGYPLSKRAVNGYMGKQVNGRHVYKEMFEVEEVLTPKFDPLDTLPDSRRNSTSQSALNYEDLIARRNATSQSALNYEDLVARLNATSQSALNYEDLAARRNATSQSALNYEDLIARRNATSQSARSNRKRYKRQGQQHLYIDVIAVVDFALYSQYYSGRKETTVDAKKSGAITEIHISMLIIMNGMNMLYKTITTLPYTIHVGFTSIVIATTAAESSWSENERIQMTPIDWVYGSDVLRNFKEWVTTTTTLPNYDHAMTFTGLDIYQYQLGQRFSEVAGITYESVLCDKWNSVSLVEHFGGFQTIFTGTHELGHTLSAQHDSEGNACPKDRHIMAADNSGYTEANKLNQWKFSSCSIDYFKTFIDDILLTNDGIQCLRNPLPRSKDLPQTLSKLPGQLYPPNEQCRMVKGDGSVLCAGFAKTPSDICTRMYCSVPNKPPPVTCSRTPSAQGTTCGNGKWCVNGECVYDDDAPLVNENCVFGDDGTYFNTAGENCTTAVRDNLFLCYQPPSRTRCCESCAKKYRPVKDCEYGDQQSNCIKQYCGYAGNEAYREACCETCNFGSPFTPTTTNPRPPRQTTTSFAGQTTPAYRDCPGNKDRQEGCDRQVCVYANDDYKWACCYTCNPASPITTTTLKPVPPLTPAPTTIKPGPPLTPAPATIKPGPPLTPAPATIKPGSPLTPAPATIKPGPPLTPAPATIKPSSPLTPLPPVQSSSPEQDTDCPTSSVTALSQKWWLQLSVVVLAVLMFN